MDCKLEIVRFAAEDVIATSVLVGLTGSFYIPTGQYTGAGSFSGDYVQFSGTFGSYSGGAYEITDVNGAMDGVDSDRNVLAGGPPYYFPDMGVTVDSGTMANIAKNFYDAYSYGDGRYYSNGASYYQQYFQ